eukprot:3571459-Prymnesium_polylepis.1
MGPDTWLGVPARPCVHVGLLGWLEHHDDDPVLTGCPTCGAQASCEDITPCGKAAAREGRARGSEGSCQSGER